MRGNIQIGAIGERRIDAGLKIVFKKKMKLFLNSTYCMVTHLQERKLASEKKKHLFTARQLP